MHEEREGGSRSNTLWGVNIIPDTRPILNASLSLHIRIALETSFSLPPCLPPSKSRSRSRDDVGRYRPILILPVLVGAKGNGGNDSDDELRRRGSGSSSSSSPSSSSSSLVCVNRNCVRGGRQGGGRGSWECKQAIMFNIREEPYSEKTRG